MSLMSSTKNSLPLRALPMPPVTLTSVALPCTLRKSSDSVVRRRNKKNVPTLTSRVMSAAMNPGRFHGVAVADQAEKIAPVASSTSPIVTTSHVHEISRTRTGFAFANLRSTSYLFGSPSGRTQRTDKK